MAMSSDVQTAPGDDRPVEAAGDGGGAGGEGGTGGEVHKPRFALPSAYTILFALIVITAAATWFIPAGHYDLDPDGSPIPGTYHEVDAQPQRIVRDSLEAPINGLYGIEDPATGNIDVFNDGTLFGAIDVALFILVIGGFIGITMRTGADRSLVVTAYQSASGLLNLVTPTSAVVMGGLAIARVPYGKYLRFVWPLLAILAGLTVVVLVLGAFV
jgi:uncharacterized ion transporter superfamily protein YfcC